MESFGHHWVFPDGSLDPRSAFAGSCEPILVTLSIVVAALAAYAALGLAERIGAADRLLAKRSWLAVGAVTMGVGVWAMHFLGMLAFRLRSLRVLGVDDHATNRALLTGQLGSWGMHVDCVANASRALESLRLAQRDGRPYDLAILDHQMPDMDGMMLARTIKSDRALAGIPLVLLTSVSYRGSAGEAKDAGFSAFLIKPIRQSQLYDCIASVMHLAGDSTPQRLITRDLLPEIQQTRSRVLVAEDNVINQKLASRMLEKLGCRVDVVANGLEAIEAIGRITYNCVFMDCQMPEMDGFEATRAIRQREARTGAHIPIVAMTANAMESDRDQCLAAGMDDYVSKPVQPAELRATLQKWIQLAEA